MGKFDGIDLGPATDEEFQTVIDWVTYYGIDRFVGSGNEKDLEEINPNLIWTEYLSGAEGDYAAAGFSPPDGDWVPQGYWVGTVPWGTEAENLFIWTNGYEACDCDGEDPDCSLCGGEGDFDYPYVQLAGEYLKNTSDHVKSKTPNFCSDCGTKLLPSAKFCSACGSKITI